MRHNPVSVEADPSYASHWAVGLSPAFPRSDWAGAILVQVQGPEARQCRVALRSHEADALAEALRDAAEGADGAFRREATLKDALFAEASSARKWMVRAVAGGAVAVELRDHRGDQDEVTMSADDAKEFADGIVAKIAEFGSGAAREQAAAEAAASAPAGPCR